MQRVGSRFDFDVITGPVEPRPAPPPSPKGGAGQPNATDAPAQRQSPEAAEPAK